MTITTIAPPAAYTPEATTGQTAQALRHIADLLDQARPPMPAQIQVSWYDWAQSFTCDVSRIGYVTADQVADWVRAWATALDLTPERHRAWLYEPDGQWRVAMRAEGTIGGIRFSVHDSAVIDTPADTDASAYELCPCRACRVSRARAAALPATADLV